MDKFKLEERLIDFAANIILFTNYVDKSYAGNHLVGQIVRSSTSPALNYGEAQSAESKKDFIHKMGICLKELRETFNCLKIIERANLTSNTELINKLKIEVNELISIFVSSIKTAKTNSEIKNR
ncbi:MAG: four helix bundle protein [Flavobacterium sp.]|jgi:four helix bundle protein